MLTLFLGVLSLEDIKRGVLKDRLLIGVGVLGVLHSGISHWVSVFVLAGLGAGLYFTYLWSKGREGLGWGDVKMMGVSGLWICPSSIPLFLIVSGGLGIIVALMWRLVYKRSRFPLGPALAGAVWICAVGSPDCSLGEAKMSYTFSGSSWGPAAGGNPESLVILLHGYGADGADLLSLGKSWASLLPHTVFVAPNGPFECEANPMGRQWFGVRDWDSPRIVRELQAITPSFNAYIDNLLKTYHLSSNRVAFVGFSQGTIVALHIALLRPQCAGVVGYSGAFLEDPLELKMAKPPVLLVHGEEDSVLSSELSKAAEARLKMLGIPVTLSLLPGLEHQIDGRGLGMGGAFLKEVLGAEQEDGVS